MYNPDTLKKTIESFSINNTPLALEYTEKLIEQFEHLLLETWVNKDELLNYIINYNDVLQDTCDDLSSDFDWNEARHLQYLVVDCISEKLGLN